MKIIEMDIKKIKPYPQNAKRHEELKRNCRMIEKDENYCDVIIHRWQELTGKKAEKI